MNTTNFSRSVNEVASPVSGRGVTAVLGPTNTGKTHLAIERMLAQPSGIIGLPLRLLAREVYGRVVEQVGAEQVALVTGEEKILPKNARFQICTVEAMPEQVDSQFVAIDEVQLAANLERGHVFTDRIMNLRGTHETMLLGAATMRPVLERLLPGINVVTRPRMSQLLYAGQKKITRLPRRSAIVAFSSDEVYAIAELIRRQRGAAAVVLGSLSPRTRNAQVALYQSGDVDFLVATDAIGMGLNLDVDHVAFAQDQKFDGYHHRRLKPSEFAQIAGRAGRHIKDGTFGVTSRVEPFDDKLVEQLEGHDFEPEKVLQWRKRPKSISSVEHLIEQLETPSSNPNLVKAPLSTDQKALAAMVAVKSLRDRCASGSAAQILWQVSQIPDYRKIAPANHADLLGSIFMDISDDGVINESWLSTQVKQTDNCEGDIDALSNRIAHIRTWTYVSQRDDWLKDAPHWQEKTRDIENRLSDALHERLTKRFVDRRTSVLMKRLRENTMLEAEIAATGSVTVEGHHVGELSGFRFTSDPTADGPDAKAARAAAQKALAGEIEARAERLAASPNSDIVCDREGTLRWIGAPVGRLAAGESFLSPQIILLADEQLSGTPRDKVATRLDRWLKHTTETLIKPLLELSAGEELDGIARGVAFRLVENQGLIDRRDIADDIRSLGQEERGLLRKKGVRFGAYHIFVPSQLKPAPAELITLLWAVHNDALSASGKDEVVVGLSSGRTSLAVNPDINRSFYGLAGYRILGSRAVRVDILERLADFIRPAISWRYKPEQSSPRPEGAWDGVGFTVTTSMLSILGSTHDDMKAVLQGLGYRSEAKTEADVNSQFAVWDTSTATASSPGDEDPISTETKPAPVEGEETIVATTPKDEAPSAAESPEPVEIKMIDIWRPGRNHAPGKPHENRKNEPKRFTGKGKKPKHGGAAGKAKHKPQYSKPIDPDSPFAKLAALKTDLAKKDG